MAVPSDHDIILALGEDLPVGIWVARAPNGELVYANRMFGEIMGMLARPDQKAGNYTEPYGIYTREGTRYPEDRLPFVRALEEGAVVVVDDITIRRSDGTSVDVRAFARPVNDPITHVVIAFFDITREVAAERARAESDRRLQQAQRLEAIGTLAGGVAHDFNNLIFGIKLLASELAATEEDPKRRDALALIDDITERSAKLTRSLLGFARQGKRRTVPVDLDDVVDAMSELLRRTLTSMTVELDLAHERVTVVGDQTQLEQVIMNLVVNARDSEGAKRIAIRTRVVDLAAMPAGAIGAAVPGRHVVLEVADDGPGIPADLRDRVFEPYFTTKTKGPQRGTGLGLATVLGIAESHGGSCELDVGIDGRGTTVRVFLPASSLSAGAMTQPISTIVPTGTGTILVVDDDPIVRRAIASALEGLGYQTAEAESGADAVEIYITRRDELRAVVLDMVMPGMNGKQTYLALRQVDPSVGVILMSGYSLDDEVQEILDLGVRSFVSKPYAVEELARAVAALAS